MIEASVVPTGLEILEQEMVIGEFLVVLQFHQVQDQVVLIVVIIIFILSLVRVV